jgi:hypothetical protein
VVVVVVVDVVVVVVVVVVVEIPSLIFPLVDLLLLFRGGGLLIFLHTIPYSKWIQIQRKTLPS